MPFSTTVSRYAAQRSDPSTRTRTLDGDHAPEPEARTDPVSSSSGRLSWTVVCGLLGIACSGVALGAAGGGQSAAGPGMGRDVAHGHRQGIPPVLDSPSDTAQGLLCDGPDSRAFDFWIGEWDVLNRNRRPDGVEFHPTGGATDKVHAVVGGCAIVEHWRGDAIGSYILGFSIRAYDRRSEEWVIALLWPTTGVPSFGELRGDFRHGRGQFFSQRLSTEGDTVKNRFVFSDIRSDALRWENGTSRDGGRSWVGHWIMEFSRRPDTAPVLANGATMTVRRCPGEPHRRFDSSLGEWQGTRVTPGGDTTAVRTHVIRILEGCGVVERSRSLDGTWESFAVRAWEPEAERWVQFVIDSERRTLLRLEAEGANPVFRGVGEIDGPARRATWQPGPDGEPGWVVEEREGPEAPWRIHSLLRFEQRLGAL